jgi:hypothetical protein
MPNKPTPKVDKIGKRRVRTQAKPGQGEEPPALREDKDSTANDQRLKEDKPPHY